MRVLTNRNGSHSNSSAALTPAENREKERVDKLAYALLSLPAAGCHPALRSLEPILPMPRHMHGTRPMIPVIGQVDLLPVELAQELFLLRPILGKADSPESWRWYPQLRIEALPPVPSLRAS